MEEVVTLLQLISNVSSLFSTLNGFKLLKGRWSKFNSNTMQSSSAIGSGGAGDRWQKKKMLLELQVQSIIQTLAKRQKLTDELPLAYLCNTGNFAVPTKGFVQLKRLCLAQEESWGNAKEVYVVLTCL